ncbi:hypothetical protein B0H10DRAFT_2041246 [Mycena sp. CBHHK59/15]|nr:hypothetical protein B0H10DRAFT_2041246 [Mycena sp. CBHHK59/15]
MSQNFARCRWLELLSNIGPFPFDGLPVEIALVILKMATTKSGTYAVLMRTSRSLAGLVRLECVPEMVVLNNRPSAMSFYQCVTLHPGVGAGVKQLWFSPGITRQQAQTIGAAIINACGNLERLMCLPEDLVNMCSLAFFQHTALVDVTLVDPIIPWDRLLGAPHGAALFRQITALRLIGGTHPVAPPHGASFPRLTDLTVAGQSTSCVQTYLVDRARFPALIGVVVTVPYVDWRDIGMNFLMSEPGLQDNRLCVLHCPKKWKELDVWREGAQRIWDMGVNEWNTRNGL